MSGWHAELAGNGGPIARSGGLVVATSSAAMRGTPGAIVVGLDAATGAERWKLAVDATDWSVIAAVAPVPDGGVVIGGSFSGTLRAGDKVAASAGLSDGFVARITPAGEVRWLVRLGGAGADAVQGVAATADRIAIAGTFTAGADLLGEPLVPVDERSAFSDGFVGELDAAGARRWVATFGGILDDAVAGVAIDSRGRIAVAGTARDTVHVGTTELFAKGPADGLVSWWQPGGAPGPAVLLGGADFDGLSAIAAVGEHVVVGGFFSGSLRLGDRTLTAGGGDDAFLAALDETGQAVASWQVGGEGREEVVAVAALPGGFVAGVAHTAAAAIDDAKLPAPADPASGAALVVRGIR